MEASAGLVAGSHNRNELVVIRGHEEVHHDTIITKQETKTKLQFVYLNLCMYNVLG